MGHWQEYTRELNQGSTRLVYISNEMRRSYLRSQGWRKLLTKLETFMIEDLGWKLINKRGELYTKMIRGS